jgi:hypothetical protein
MYDFLMLVLDVGQAFRKAVVAILVIGALSFLECVVIAMIMGGR